MPRDKRLFMTFPNDFPEHPKMRPLSDAAFRAFVEMVGYSRTQDLDGRIPVKLAKSKWKSKPIGELLANHSERPTLTLDGDDYVIRDYAQHQQTRADREASAEVSRENGKLGGRPKTRKEPGNNPGGFESGTKSEPGEKQSQSQSQSLELDDDMTNEIQPGHLGEVVASGTQYSDVLVEKAEKRGILNLPATHQLLQKAVGEVFLSPAGAIRLAAAVADKAKEPVQKVDAYVASACRNSPDEVWGLYDQLDLGGVP